MSPRIFIWINMATTSGATGHALAEDGHMLNTETGHHIGTVLNRLVMKTAPYWTKYPRGFTLEVVEIGEDPRRHIELGDAIGLHRALQQAQPEAEPEADVWEGGDGAGEDAPEALEPWNQ